MGTGAIDQNPPDWLTNSFLEEILRDYLQDSNILVSDIITLKISPENEYNYYASNLYRVNFKITKSDKIENFSIIIKEHPKDESGVLVHKHQLFKREILVYKEIMPHIQRLLTSINDATQIAPICYYTTLTPEPFLLLEDLKLQQFEMFESGRLFNLDQVLPVLQKMAKFHACSVVIAHENTGIMDYFEEGAISNNPDRQESLGFYPAHIRTLASEVAGWSGYEEICLKLYNLEGTILERCVELFNSDPSEFRVLNLGDLWVNNVMIRLDDQLMPEDVMLLDFQLVFYGSPAIDLNYFIYGSINENVRKVHFKYMLREYHKCLAETLEKLCYVGYVPTLKDLHIAMIQKSLQGVIAAACLAPVVLTAPKSKENEMNSAEITASANIHQNGRQEQQQNYFENPKYKAFIQRTLKEFELSGFLD